MIKVVWALPFALVIAWTAAGCSSEDTCIDDRSCGPGNRCFKEPGSGSGTCGPCPTEEVPYDGIDTDCNERTPDFDLDFDGDNWVGAAVRPGTDCDDEDPEVKGDGNQPEICGDGKDNDCDMAVDELDCGDTQPPTLVLDNPANQAKVAGSFEILATASDDVGIVRVEFEVPGLSILDRDIDPPQTQLVLREPVDTEMLPDGPLDIVVAVIDVKGNRATASARVTIDNTTAPVITIEAPTPNAFLAGRFRVIARARDAEAIVSMNAYLDGVLVGTSTGAVMDFLASTSTATEGTQVLAIGAQDAGGNRTAAEDREQVTFRIDREPPIISITRPTVDEVAINPFPIEVTAQDPAGLTMRAYFIEPGIGQVTVATADTDSSAPLTIDRTATLPEGNQVLFIAATDKTRVDFARTNSATTSIAFPVKDPNPEIEFIRPEARNDAVMGLFDLEVDVTSPPGEDIVDVEFLVNGQAIPDDDQTDFFAVYDFTDLTGTATITVVARDSADLTTTSSVVADIVPVPNLRYAESVPTAPSTRTYDIADFDGDGINDLVYAYGFGVELRLGGRLRGRWQPGEPELISMVRAAEVRAADVNQDGRMDLVLIEQGRGLTTLINPGPMGQWMQGPVITGLGDVTEMELADLDGDRDLDAVVSGRLVPGIVLLNFEGAFTEVDRLNGDDAVTDLVLKDADRDGDIDVFVGRSGASNIPVSVFRNNGAGFFSAAFDTSTLRASEQIAVGDITGDGTVDVVGASRISTFQLLVGDPLRPGAFIPSRAISTQPNPSSVDVLDIDGDNRDDVVIALDSSNAVEIWTTTGTTGLVRTQGYLMGQSFFDMRIIDVDGDGLRDIVGLGESPTRFFYARNLNPGFHAALTRPVDFTLGPVAVGEIVDPPGPDLAVAINGRPGVPVGARAIEIWTPLDGRLQPSGTELPLHPQFDAVTGVSVGNVDGDGRVDIVVGTNGTRSPSRPTAAVFVQNGAGTFQRTDLSLDNPSAVAVGDVDNDGANEALFALNPSGGGSDSVLVRNFDGDNDVILPTDAGPLAVAVGDIDLDPMGYIDFVVANGISDNLSAVRWNGRQLVASAPYNARPRVRDVLIARTGVDARPDLIGLAADVLFILKGDPILEFRPPESYVALPIAYVLTAGDWNNDGITDFAAADISRVVLLIGKPNGGVFDPIPFAASNAVQEMVVDDFDGDGRPDLAIGQTRAVGFVFNDGDQY